MSGACVPTRRVPGFYLGEKLFEDARRLRATMGDAWLSLGSSIEGNEGGQRRLGRTRLGVDAMLRRSSPPRRSRRMARNASASLAILSPPISAATPTWPLHAAKPSSTSTAAFVVISQHAQRLWLRRCWCSSSTN